MELGSRAANSIQTTKMSLYKQTPVGGTRLDKELRVEADVSNFATGGMLSIKCEDNKWRPSGIYLKVVK